MAIQHKRQSAKETGGNPTTRDNGKTCHQVDPMVALGKQDTGQSEYQCNARRNQQRIEALVVIVHDRGHHGEHHKQEDAQQGKSDESYGGLQNNHGLKNDNARSKYTKVLIKQIFFIFVKQNKRIKPS